MRHPHTHKPFVEQAQARCYVGAPIVPRGRSIGFFHADHHFSGRPVDDRDRETLWAFTTGFAHVYERSVLLERLREQRARFEQLAASTATAVSDLCAADIGVERARRRAGAGSAWATAAASADRDDALRLTPREVEVLGLMAGGATNAGIARRAVHRGGDGQVARPADPAQAGLVESGRGRRALPAAQRRAFRAAQELTGDRRGAGQARRRGDAAGAATASDCRPSLTSATSSVARSGVCSAGRGQCAIECSSPTAA